MLRGQTFVEPQFWRDALDKDDLFFKDNSFFGSQDGFTFGISLFGDDTLISLTSKHTDFGTETVAYVDLTPFYEKWAGGADNTQTEPYYLDVDLFYTGVDGRDDLIAVRPEFNAKGGTGSDTFIVRDTGQLDILDFSLDDTIAFDLAVLPHLPGQQAGIDALLPFVTAAEWQGDNFMVDFGDTATLTFWDVTPGIVEVGIIGLQNIEVWS